MFLKKTPFGKWNKWGSKKLFQIENLVQLRKKNEPSGWEERASDYSAFITEHYLQAGKEWRVSEALVHYRWTLCCAWNAEEVERWLDERQAANQTGNIEQEDTWHSMILSSTPSKRK